MFKFNERKENVRYIEFKNSTPLENVNKITNIKDDAIGVFISKQYRYSYDNEIWSKWRELTQKDITDIKFRDKQYFYLQIRYFRNNIISGNVNNIFLFYDTSSTIPTSISTDVSINADYLNQEPSIYYLTNENHIGNYGLYFENKNNGYQFYKNVIDSSFYFKTLDSSGFDISLTDTSDNIIINVNNNINNIYNNDISQDNSINNLNNKLIVIDNSINEINNLNYRNLGLWKLVPDASSLLFQYLDGSTWKTQSILLATYFGVEETLSVYSLIDATYVSRVDNLLNFTLDQFYEANLQFQDTTLNTANIGDTVSFDIKIDTSGNWMCEIGCVTDNIYIHIGTLHGWSDNNTNIPYSFILTDNETPRINVSIQYFDYSGQPCSILIDNLTIN